MSAAALSAPMPPAVATDPVLPARTSSWATTKTLIELLARATAADRSAWGLPVAALSVASALCLIVTGGARFFFTIEGDLAETYRLLAVMALVILVIPLVTLAMAATRLAATRRDTRLSSLRLLGASTVALRLLTLAETAATAFAGALVGVVGYLMLMPVVGLLHFNGGPITARGTWLGVLPVLGVVLGIVVLAVLASAVGLRRVAVSPLGVRLRQRPQAASLWRLAIAGLFVMAVFALSAMLDSAAELLPFLLVLVGIVGLPLFIVDLLGPLVVRGMAKLGVRMAGNASALLAARFILENPKQLWRQISSLGVATFVGVLVGVGMATIPQDGRDELTETFASDLSTGVILTLLITFLTVAVSVAINQTAAVLDRRSIFVGLDLLGMPIGRIDAARRRAVWHPVLGTVVMSAAVAMLPVLALSATSSMFDPRAAAFALGAVVAGVLLVLGALQLSRVTLRQVVAAGAARAE